MKRLTVVLTVVVLVAGVFAVQAARGQYYTPLRYDLRYTSPTYIPSGALRYGPPQQADPYRFGAPLHGNLGVTGNLRMGKSFRGNTPYTATGSQLTETLPSARLSNFRRDSFGVSDLGTELQYGHTEPYFSCSQSVTTPQTAGLRFHFLRSEDQIRRSAPDYNSLPYTEPIRSPSNIFAAPGGWTGVTPEIIRRLQALQTTAPHLSAALATGSLSITDLQRIEGLVLPQTLRGEEEAAAQAATAETGRFENPYDAFERQFRTSPMNLYRSDEETPALPEEASPDGDLRLQYGEQADGLERPEPWFPEDVDEFETQPLGLGSGEPQPAFEGRPWAEVALPGEEEENVPAPAPGVGELPSPAPSRPESGYAAYVLRAHDAMKRGVFSQAEALYAAGMALEPDRPAAFFGRIHALLGGRMYLQAAMVLRRVLAQHPEWVAQAPNLKSVFPDEDMVRRIYADVKDESGRGARGHDYTFLMGYLEFVARNYDEARTLLTRSAGARADESKAEAAILDAMPAP